ncbi:uncharacterized protein LOC112164156 [Rosa chinensis]|uniref:uncharacterized protein LOC112164156 n=1 Tax=Rosa chinensis TaxID=74649 RepID=UPI001AD923AE|nr:uncharacterized protein LOC112164156 [Rosa chinensis]
MQISNARDKNPRTDDMHFYGVIKHIWELDYYKFRVPLFKCDWVENVRGIKVDELGFTLVNLNRIGHLNDAFVLATHVKQIFYIQDPLDVQWSVVVRCPDKDYQEANDDEELQDIEVEQQPFNATLPSVETFDDIVGDDHINYMRPGDEAIWVMAPRSNNTAKARAIALRIKALQMKRGKKIVSKPAVEEIDVPLQSTFAQQDAAPNKAATPKKAQATSKKTRFRLAHSNKSASPKRSVSKQAGKSKKAAYARNVGKSKAPDEEDNVTGGLQLLKRGMVTMNRISRRLIRGKRLKVECNAQGEPIGKAAKEMQSYIGVLARTRIPISIKDWRGVKLDEKDKIWESIEEAFVVPKEWKKLVITSAANKWREFKSKLTNWYIMPYLDNPELLEFPPDDYRSIDQHDWDKFVADRTTTKFKELREAQIKKRKENKYPHRMARKGYANLQEELSETIPIEELDRATMWVKARQDKTGNFNGPAVKKTVEKIDKLRQKLCEGEVNSSGSDDILTLALGNPEAPGRESVEDTLRVSVKRILAEEKETIIANERAKWELEMEHHIAKERAAWEDRFKKLEEKVVRKEVDNDSLKTLTPLNDIGSGQGSCSRQNDKGMKLGQTELARNVKKKLILNNAAQVDVEEETAMPFLDSKLSSKFASVIEDDVGIVGRPLMKTKFWEELPKSQVMTNTVKLESKLAINSLDNVVALGTIVEVDIEATKQTIHGVPMGEENVRVSVTKAIVEDALLPFPIKDEIVKIRDAIGTCVAWPKNLIIPPTVEQKEGVKRKIVKKRNRDIYDDDDHDDLQNLPAKLPLPLKMLCQWANTFLKDGFTIHTTLGEDLFGHPKKVAIFRRDVYAMTNMKEISNGSLVMYMRFVVHIKSVKLY